MTCSVPEDQLNPEQDFVLIAILKQSCTQTLKGQYLYPVGCHRAESRWLARSLQVVLMAKSVTLWRSL
jgi:hypothetical protein